MSVSSLAAARHLCARSDWTMSNLALQKMLYLSHMTFMGETDGAPLVTGTFEAWDYGPVEPQVYGRVALFGRSAIQDVFGSVSNISHTEEARVLDECFDFLRDKSPSELVEISHWKEGAWAKHYVPGRRGIIIPRNDILMEYKRRLEVSGDTDGAVSH